MKSGREDLPMNERQQLLANEILWLKSAMPQWDGNNGRVVHDLNSLLGRMQSCAKGGSWAEAHISKTELLVMAYRRGGFEEFKRTQDVIYPPWKPKAK